MKIGIIGAMEIEVKLLRDELQDRQDVQICNFVFHHGKIGGNEVIVLLSGIGKVSASVATTLLIDKFEPDLIINTGTAGGLRDTQIHDIILATEVRHHDVDVTAFGYEYGQQAKMPPAFLPNREYLIEAENYCKKYTKQLRTGLIVSGDSFISSRERRALIEDKFPQALAVEMEASAIAQTCYMMKVPFLILRSISDNAGEGDTISYDTFVEQAGNISAQINIDFVKNL